MLSKVFFIILLLWLFFGLIFLFKENSITIQKIQLYIIVFATPIILYVAIPNIISLYKKFIKKSPQKTSIISSKHEISTNIPQVWRDYQESNSIVNIETNIMQLNIHCKDIASKVKSFDIKILFYVILVVVVISIILILVTGGDNSPLRPALLFTLLAVFYSIKEIIRVYFSNYEKIIKEGKSAEDVVRVLSAVNVNLKNLSELGTIISDTKNTITENTTHQVLGNILIERSEDKKEDQKLIILDVNNCNIFAIKEFKITDIKKFKITKDFTTKDSVDALYQNANRLDIKAEIAAVGGDNIRLASAMKVRQDANKAYSDMDKLYILFNDGSQFVLSNLTEQARNMYDTFNV